MTSFYIPIFTWYEVSYLDQSMEFVISNSYLHGSYLHPFHDQFGWSLQEICRICSPTFVMDLLPYPFSIGLLVSSFSIRNIFIRVHVIIGSSTNANIKTMIFIRGSLYIYIYSNILTNMQYPMHAMHILMHFKHKLKKQSYNQQDRVLRKTSLFKPLIFSWNSFSTQQLVDFIVLAAPGHATVQICPFDNSGHY